MKKISGFIFAMAIMIAPSITIADSITPSSFSDTLAVGESVTISKTVTVSTTGTTKVDVAFLADTTGSMGGSINAIKTSASSILAGIAGLGDVAFSVGEYKDTFDAYRYRLNTDITTSQASAQAGINLWSAGGGADLPEANIFALEHTATDTSWRAGSERILVWFGDAPGHDPDGGSTEASATAALMTAGIQVEAISVGGVLGGLNAAGGASAEGGAAIAGQADRIAAATGGHVFGSANDSAIIDVIEAAISSAIANYTSVGLDLSEVPSGVSVSSSPGSHSGSFDRSIERTFDFDVTFTGVTPGTYDFPIYGTVDDGRIATEDDHIVVSGGASVPEPSTLLLLGTGISSLALIIRKK